MKYMSDRFRLDLHSLPDKPTLDVGRANRFQQGVRGFEVVWHSRPSLTLTR